MIDMTTRDKSTSRFSTFREFYPFYLSEHANPTCRRLHFIGSTLVLLVAVVAIVERDARWLWLAPLAGYGFAWAGHFFFEQNRPATVSHPLYSFVGDWAMFRDMLLRRIRF